MQAVTELGHDRLADRDAADLALHQSGDQVHASDRPKQRKVAGSVGAERHSGLSPTLPLVVGLSFSL